MGFEVGCCREERFIGSDKGNVALIGQLDELLLNRFFLR